MENEGQIGRTGVEDKRREPLNEYQLGNTLAVGGHSEASGLLISAMGSRNWYSGPELKMLVDTRDPLGTAWPNMGRDTPRNWIVAAENHGLAESRAGGSSSRKSGKEYKLTPDGVRSVELWGRLLGHSEKFPEFSLEKLNGSPRVRKVDNNDGNSKESMDSSVTVLRMLQRLVSASPPVSEADLLKSMSTVYGGDYKYKVGEEKDRSQLVSHLERLVTNNLINEVNGTDSKRIGYELDEKQREMIGGYVDIVGGFAEQDFADYLTHGKNTASKIVNDSDRFSKLLAKAYESSSAAHARKKKEVENALLVLIKENSGITAKELAGEVSKMLGTDYSVGRIREILRGIRDRKGGDETLSVEVVGRIKKYFPVGGDSEDGSRAAVYNLPTSKAS